MTGSRNALGRPKLTVAICTRNRPDALRACLESICASSDLVSEVVVSDDGSSGAAATVAAEFDGRIPNLHVIAGPRRGLAANRNRCIDAASGDYLLFIDDDARVDRRFLDIALSEASVERIVTGFERRCDGLVRPKNPGFLGFLEKSTRGTPCSIVINSTIFPTRFLRRTFFDEFYRYGCEETDIALAARSAGVSIHEVAAGNDHDPSPLGRGGYDVETVRSRAYLNARRYLGYERRRLVFAAYVLLGLVNACGYALRTRGVRHAGEAASAFVDGVTAGTRGRSRRVMARHSPRVSVVIPTWRRPEQLENCLRGIARLNRKPDEVIVVRRREDVGAAEVLRRSHSPHLKEIVVVKEGQVAALSAGAGAATGEIVAFLDDDAVPRPYWLERLLLPYADPRVGAVGGRDVVHTGGEIDSGTARTVGTVLWFGRVVGNHQLGFGAAREVDFLKGTNMSYRSECLLLPNGLRGDGAEVCNDMAMSLAVKERGWKVVYNPSAEVDHFPGPRFGEDGRNHTLHAFQNTLFNRCYVVDSLRPRVRLPRLAYGLLVGDRSTPGLLRVLAAAVLGDAPLQRLFWPSVRTQWAAWREARRRPLAMVPISHSGGS